MRSQVMILLALALVMMVAVDYAMAELKYCGSYGHSTSCRSCCSDRFGNGNNYKVQGSSCYCNVSLDYD